VAALFGCAVTTGFGVVENNAKVRIGETVVVFGAGGIGLNIIQAASLVSGYPIIAVDLYDNRLELAKQMGADHVINSTIEDPFLRIEKILNGKELDVFIDNTGNPQIIEQGYELTKSSGRVILVGVPKKDDCIHIYSLPLHFGKILTGSHGGESDPHVDIKRYLSIYNANRFNLRTLITEKHELGEINLAISNMRAGKTSGRCLLEFI